jgi:hypothetical protein
MGYNPLKTFSNIYDGSGWVGLALNDVGYRGYNDVGYRGGVGIAPLLASPPLPNAARRVLITQVTCRQRKLSILLGAAEIT